MTRCAVRGIHGHQCDLAAGHDGSHHHVMPFRTLADTAERDMPAGLLARPPEDPGREVGDEFAPDRCRGCWSALYDDGPCRRCGVGTVPVEPCGACRGAGHFSAWGKPSEDPDDRPCMECDGRGTVPR